MSIFDYLFDSEWSQRSDIERLKRSDARNRRHRQRQIQRSRKQATEVADRVSELEEQVGEMALYVKALVRVLDRRGGVPVAELLTTMEAIDAEDGEVDGQTRL